MRARQRTLSRSQTDRYVWQCWLSEGLPSVPARRRHLYCKLSLIPCNSLTQTHHMTFSCSVFFPSSSFFSPHSCVVHLLRFFRDTFKRNQSILFSLYLAFHDPHICLYFATPLLHNATTSLSPCPPTPSCTLPSHFLYPPLAYQGARVGEWTVFCSGAAWWQEGKRLFYGFIYGSVHITEGREGMKSNLMWTHSSTPRGEQNSRVSDDFWPKYVLISCLSHLYLFA